MSKYDTKSSVDALRSPASIHGFDTLKASEGDDEKKQKYYTGGAKSGSGQNVVANPVNSGDTVDRVFDSAKSHGAINKYEEEQKTERFAGSGATLAGGVQPAPPKPPQIQRKILTFYKDCFTVDDGPPRRYDDPANKPFLDDINKGVVPRELEMEVGGADLDVELINKKTEEWKDVPRPFKAFQTTGQSLGAAPSSGTQAEAKTLVLDEEKKATNIQVRLANGQRLKVRVNLTHTVGDLRSHIEATHPTGAAFELRTTYPQKALTDDNQTIQDAGLSGAAIVQRLS